MLIVYITLSILVILLTYLYLDYRGPARVALKPSVAFNMNCRKAKELIIQEVDHQGSVWASRGLLLYRLSPGEDFFRRMAHAPASFSYIWLNNFSLFRRFTNKPECIEFSILPDGSICLMSDGWFWVKAESDRKFRRTLKLRHFGRGVGRGIFSSGLLSLQDGRIFFGEYFRNPQRTEDVHVYKSLDNGESWKIARVFETGSIRHVHGIQQDPFTGRLWLCAGDDDHESIIGWSENEFKDIHLLGSGSQIWRTTQLVFTREAIYWGTDTGSEELAGIYRWDRASKEVSRIHSSNGAILFGTQLAGGTLVFTTDREGFPNEKDHLTRMIVVEEGDQVREIECGTWWQWEKGLRYSFAMLRSQRKQGFPDLLISVINQKEFPAGTLLLFEEKDLKSRD